VKVDNSVYGKGWRWIGICPPFHMCAQMNAQREVLECFRASSALHVRILCDYFHLFPSEPQKGF
ncbi:MAG: hypothetical protein LBG86_00940, partial [Puniceicoccales bacterium]|nr:hypothetical protein [Puniceicoccales bacterium]